MKTLSVNSRPSLGVVCNPTTLLQQLVPCSIASACLGGCTHVHSTITEVIIIVKYKAVNFPKKK